MNHNLLDDIYKIIECHNNFIIELSNLHMCLMRKQISSNKKYIYKRLFPMTLYPYDATYIFGSKNDRMPDHPINQNFVNDNFNFNRIIYTSNDDETLYEFIRKP